MIKINLVEDKKQKRTECGAADYPVNAHLFVIVCIVSVWVCDDLPRRSVELKFVSGRIWQLSKLCFEKYAVQDRLL